MSKQEELDQQKTELINDLVATSTVILSRLIRILFEILFLLLHY